MTKAVVFTLLLILTLSISAFGQKKKMVVPPCLESPNAEAAFSVGDFGSKAQSAKPAELVSEEDPNNAPLRLISKPIAKRTDSQDCSEGTVTLRIEFLSDGTIGKVRVILGLTKGLNKDAVEAARKIKFYTATKNGKAMTVTKTLQYNFTIY